MMTNLLEIKDWSVSYGAIDAVKNVSLHIAAGEIISLIGANGAGKSSLLMSLMGAVSSSGGAVKLRGEEITGLSPEEIAAHKISLVPEGRHIFPHLLVRENLQMGAWLVDEKSAAQNLEFVLDLFPRLGERMTQRAGTLSGGEQQMLAIGRALMGSPDLLLLDEPSLGLAPILVQQIFAALKALHEKGLTILLVEQNAYQALQLASRGYVMANGKIVLHGAAEDLRENPDVKAAYLGAG